MQTLASIVNLWLSLANPTIQSSFEQRLRRSFTKDDIVLSAVAGARTLASAKPRHAVRSDGERSLTLEVVTIHNPKPTGRLDSVFSEAKPTFFGHAEGK